MLAEKSENLPFPLRQLLSTLGRKDRVNRREVAVGYCSMEQLGRHAPHQKGGSSFSLTDRRISGVTIDNFDIFAD